MGQAGRAVQAHRRTDRGTDRQAGGIRGGISFIAFRDLNVFPLGAPETCKKLGNLGTSSKMQAFATKKVPKKFWERFGNALGTPWERGNVLGLYRWKGGQGSAGAQRNRQADG